MSINLKKIGNEYVGKDPSGNVVKVIEDVDFCTCKMGRQKYTLTKVSGKWICNGELITLEFSDGVLEVRMS